MTKSQTQSPMPIRPDEPFRQELFSEGSGQVPRCGDPCMAASDGYGTGFVIHVLRCAGVSTDDPRIQKGITWLKTHQRASGRWFTRSPYRDRMHYITNAGTAYAILALAACGEMEALD